MCLSINRDPVKIQILGLQTWARAWDSILLRSLLVALKLLVHWLHFEE